MQLTNCACLHEDTSSFVPLRKMTTREVILPHHNPLANLGKFPQIFNKITDYFCGFLNFILLSIYYSLKQ